MSTDPQKCTLVALFDSRDDAELAIDELRTAGFTDDQIGFAIRGQEAVRGGMITDAQGTKDRRGALAGMATGGVVGGALAAAASMLLPGVGPVIASGILMAAIGGAAAGTAVGGILGAMIGLGVSEDEAKYFDQMFQSGRAIVAVKPGPGTATGAAQILARHGGYDTRATHHPPVQTEGVFSQP